MGVCRTHLRLPAWPAKPSSRFVYGIQTLQPVVPILNHSPWKVFAYSRWPKELQLPQFVNISAPHAMYARIAVGGRKRQTLRPRGRRRMLSTVPVEIYGDSEGNGM